MGARTRSLANALNNINTSTNTLTGSVDGSAITSGTVANARLVNSGQFTLDGTTIALGGTASIVPYPTFSSVGTSVLLPSTQTSVVITGTNFQTGAIVEAVNSSTGALTIADSVSFDSATQLTCNFTLASTGTYFIRIENKDGLAVRSGSAVLTVSNAPFFSTAAGSLGSITKGDTVNFQILAFDDDSTAVTSYSLQSGSLPTGLTLNGASTVGSITGTESGTETVNTTFNFTIRATDNESQTTDRAFSITVNLPEASGGGQFNP